MQLRENLNEHDLRDSRNELQRIHSNQLFKVSSPYDMLNTEGNANTQNISHSSSRTQTLP